MARQARPRWEPRSARWVAAVGEPDPKTGKARTVILRDESGAPVSEGDRAGAERSLARLLAERERAATSGRVVSEVVAAYLDWQFDRSKRRTVRLHRWHLERWANFPDNQGVLLGHRPVSSIGVADLTRYRKHLESEGWGTGTIRLAYASILACWAWAARPVEDREPVRFLNSNPFAGIARPRVGPGRQLVLPVPTIDALLDFAERRVPRYSRDRVRDRLKALALKIIVESGARTHEVVEMEWGWVHEADRVIVMQSGVHKTGHRTGRERIIGVSPHVAETLAQLRVSGDSHPRWVFAPASEVDRDHAPQVDAYDSWFRRLRSEAQVAGIAVPDMATPYTLRHSFVTHAGGGGMDLRELAPGLGHSADVAERTYFHVQRTAIRDLMDRARVIVGVGSRPVLESEDDPS